MITGRARTAELLRYVGWASAAVLVTRYGKVNLTGTGQIESVHEGDEFLLGATATQARVAGLLLGDTGNEALLVVVPGVHQRLAGQREQLVVDAVVEVRGAAGLEIGAAAAFDQ